ncbi:hypothetical protein H5410_060848 [Solanum commersonii]|uniref:Uncharacterized protein n=1 Tax=Solanum commersonii TaxID=4109 RepID=A0A9J5W6C9_SOLCO|nr:hypothetical protein H5410_060848 [Solanum commersonii]
MEASTSTGLGGNAAVKELGISKSTEQEVHEGLGVGVGKDASADISGGCGNHFQSFFASLGTRARLHSSMINTGKGSEVWHCLALITISCAIIIPRLSFISSMMQPKQAALACRKIDLFWDGIIVLLMKPNQNLSAMFRSLFSIGAPISSHLGASSDMRGSNHFFIISNVVVRIMSHKKHRTPRPNLEYTGHGAFVKI